MHLMSDLSDELKRQIEQIELEFLSKFFPADPQDGPDKYHLHVKAYCLLAHAAFEEFVEKISIELMKGSIQHWYDTRGIAKPLLALCLFYDARLRIEESEEVEQDRHFDAIRTVLNEVKQAHSKAILDNHGFSLKYLRAIFTPVAVDVSLDLSLVDSLRTLADARGSYAHTAAELAHFTDRKRATHPMTPEKAREIVGDCLKLCLKIADDALKILEPVPASSSKEKPAAGAR
ncbi:HEPN domain-containing protein [Bradyrhizobium sp. HKCCYLS1011]|uniref:HEPN domain-containing protein n=1 Tax=Bradyrhizobium sp. HKCCYLS1011 TaxID=3420733 RepID=UPI003EBC0C7B